MSEKIGFVSLGCPKNQVDGERMLAQLEDAGMEIVDALIDGADAVIVNTCGFIDSAKQESIDAVLEMAQLKAEGKIRKIIVVGCMAQKYHQEILEQLPEADAVAGLGAAGDIAQLVRDTLTGAASDASTDADESPEALPLTGKRLLTTPAHWAYLKIADGCSNRCAYCSIPSIRGDFRSVPMEDVLSEALDLVEGGARELILIAQDTTSYGLDLYGELRLPELLREMCKIDDLRRLRLLYCYPDRVTPELLSVMAEEPKILHYMDLPLQHISDPVLGRMNRRGTSADLRRVLSEIRAALPDIALRTTFITGLPGESNDDFEELHRFIKEQKFARLGVFAYSPQEGTPAAEMPDQIPAELAEERLDILMRTQNDIARVNAEALVGTVLEVVCEDYDGYTDMNIGRAYLDAPEIDACVYFSGAAEDGQYYSVKILGVSDDGYDLIGKRT
ncbi:MAG: 30S ribosomal protein S12 methylthiotransferase RimO [Oscillospiraceae bacterium]|jgi:ribosomal protein S12 methylthiotransferase|nr:30S ribosomal protein S12 methylthiotransferase RimO [Oscillospiraceae bacterium]